MKKKSRNISLAALTALLDTQKTRILTGDTAGGSSIPHPLPHPPYDFKLHSPINFHENQYRYRLQLFYWVLSKEMDLLNNC